VIFTYLEPFTAGWRRFWFTRIPPHSYALLRILVGLVGTLTILGAWNPSFWDPNDLVPRTAAWQLGPWLNAHGLARTFGLGLRWLLLLGYVSLALGLRSSLIAPVMYVGSVAMMRWNWLPFSAAQDLLRHLTLPLIFVDSGAVWSLDALLRARRTDGGPPPELSIWPLRLLQYQVAIVYLSAGLWKMGIPDWRAGVALHYVLNNPVYQRVPGVVPAGLFGATVALTYLTLAWELAFPFLIWFRRTRPLMLLIGVALHLGMWATIELGPFSPTMLVSYVAFLDPWRTEARMRALARLKST
jgi:hypothetical protein